MRDREVGSRRAVFVGVQDDFIVADAARKAPSRISPKFVDLVQELTPFLRWGQKSLLAFGFDRSRQF